MSGRCYLSLVLQIGLELQLFLCSGCTVIPVPEEGGGGPCGLLMYCTNISEGCGRSKLDRGRVEQDRCLTVGNHLFVRVDVGQGSGRGVSRTWETGLNSRHSPTSEAALFLVCLFYNLSYILCVCERVLCQACWLWKNNLTGFNLSPPPPHPHSSSFLFPPSPQLFLASGSFGGIQPV